MNFGTCLTLSGLYSKMRSFELPPGFRYLAYVQRPLLEGEWIVPRSLIIFPYFSFSF